MLLLFLVLVIVRPTSAVAFVVNSGLDTGDANPGNGICDDGGGNCTLRAAIEETNALPGADSLTFTASFGFAPAAPYPAILDVLTIDGTAGGFYPTINGAGAGAGANGLQIDTTGGGTTIIGLQIIAFNGAGIFINNSANNVIGTTAGVASFSNIISGNNGDGILIFGPTSTGNVVMHNWIGLDATGSGQLANGGDGIEINTATGNIIGGAAANQANFISGNTGNGIAILNNVAGNTITGNNIGFDISGIPGTPIPNAQNGIFLQNSDNNTINSNNVGGNLQNGVALTVGSDNNNIASNLLGNQLSCNFAPPPTPPGVTWGNQLNGLLISGGSTNNNVGGSGGNQIYGNTANGVQITGVGSDGNTIANNIFGATAVFVLSNCQNGVQIDTNAANNTVSGNTITLQPFGSGVLLDTNAANNSITTNVINNNAGAGIANPGGGNGNLFQANQIDANGGLGIDLNGAGVTGNDGGDGDAGPNDLQNFPVLTSALSDGATIQISGTLNSTVTTTFRVDFYSVATCDGSGNGEGAVFLGSGNVLTDGAGNVTFTAPVTSATTTGFITATTTNPGNSTSEFSACIPITPPADVAITKTDSADPITLGNSVTYTLSVVNNGPGGSNGVVVTDTLPANVTFVSASAGCTQAAGVVTCNVGALGLARRCSSPSPLRRTRQASSPITPV
ncbi:MAG: NosD domain-containing protein [Anaerolineae bacterium]